MVPNVASSCFRVFGMRHAAGGNSSRVQWPFRLTLQPDISRNTLGEPFLGPVDLVLSQTSLTYCSLDIPVVEQIVGQLSPLAG